MQPSGSACRKLTDWFRPMSLGFSMAPDCPTGPAFGGTLGTFGTGIECCRKATLAPWQVDGLSDGNAVLHSRGSVCSAVCF